MSNPEESKFTVATGPVLFGALVGWALTAAFTDNADPNPLEGMSGTDQEAVCASPVARKVLSIDDACGRLGLILPTPDNES